jgi:hypothetical protein
MKLLRTLGEEAAGPGGVSWASLVDGAPYGALRQLSVGLVRGNHFLCRATVGMLARSSGACFRPGQASPRTTVVRNSVLVGFVFLLSGLDGAACSPLCRADVLALLPGWFCVL